MNKNTSTTDLLKMLEDNSDDCDFSAESTDDYSPSELSTDTTNSYDNDDFITEIQEYIEQLNIQQENTIETANSESRVWVDDDGSHLKTFITFTGMKHITMIVVILYKRQI